MATRNSELRRKGIHLVGLAVPVLYWFANKLVVLCFIAFWLVLFIAGEIYRFRRGIPKKAEKIARPMMREYERRGTAAHVFLAAGFFVAVLFYAKDVAIAVSLIVVFGDCASAAVGGYIGGRQLIRGKTLWGTLALVLTAFVVSFWIVGVPLAFAGAITTGAVEPLPINDNFSVPVAAGLAMTAARYFL